MSPTPLSLLCALLLTLPLAIVFTITTDSVTTIVPPPLNTVHLHHTTISQRPPPTNTKNQTHHPISPPPKPSKTTNDDETAFDNDDKSLFELASHANSNQSVVHFGARKKIAFMFLTTGPLPLAPLWELYFNPTRRKHLYNIYIHADPNLRYDLIFQGVFANRTIPSKPTRRHSPSLAAAHRRLLAHALLHDPLNYHFALISPSCIPLHSFDFTYKTLIKSNKSFVEILEHEPSAWGRWTARGEGSMLPEVEFHDFRIGSQFSILTRHHAMVAMSDTRIWSKFKMPCHQENKNRCYPEESYLPTLMSMLAKNGHVAATLTYVDWKGHYDGHPHMYTRSEVSLELFRTIRGLRPRYGDEENNGSDMSMMNRRNDPFLFARKFGSDTLGGLLDIANEVILRD